MANDSNPAPYWLWIAVAVIAVLLLLYLFRGRAVAVVGRLRSRRPAPTDTASEIGSSTVIIGTWVIIFGLLGMGAIALWSHGYVQHPPGGGQFAMVFGVDVLVAAAASGVGALLGFLFGIPRTLDPASRVAVAAAANQPSATSQAALGANTNLERVSDWLTTLLIGATLVQSEKVVNWVEALGGALADPNTTVTNKAVVPLIVVYFFALAFLGVYLITRLYLTYALQQTLALLTGVAVSPVKIVPATLPHATQGAPYAPITLQATGGTSPLRWSVTPNLPAGLALDSAVGTISGTPAAATASADYTVSVIDSSVPPASASATLTLQVD
jgi:hypothetical protein